MSGSEEMLTTLLYCLREDEGGRVCVWVISKLLGLFAGRGWGWIWEMGGAWMMIGWVNLIERWSM